MRVWLSFITGLSLAISLVLYASQHLKNSIIQNLSQEAPVLARLDRRIIDLLTLGHGRLYDDYIYLWLLQHLMEKPKLSDNHNDSASMLYQKIKTVISLEPKIESIYLLSCFILAFEHSRPELCEIISIKGLHAIPDSWRIPMTQGFIFAFRLDQPAKAGIFYKLASMRKNSPSYVARLAERLLSRQHNQLDKQQSLQLLLEIPELNSIKNFLLRRLNDR